MKESTKSILWSVFIFPGAGHFYLKKWLPGAVSAVIVTGALIVILTRVMERANQIAERIILGEIPLDIGIIMALVSKQNAQGDSMLDIAQYALVAVWIIAALDAFRLGRAIDKQQSANIEKSNR